MTENRYRVIKRTRKINESTTEEYYALHEVWLDDSGKVWGIRGNAIIGGKDLNTIRSACLVNLEEAEQMEEATK